MTAITASMLYDLIVCPHRVLMDTFTDPARRDPPSPFMQLLWEKGALYETDVIANLEVPFTYLSAYDNEERERRTEDAMRRGVELIYAGRIRADGLLGDPDLLRREGSVYIAGDIKSGAGTEGPEDLSKPKKHYAVQLALYTDILERLGFSAGRRGFIWDIHGKEVAYDFTLPQGPRTPRTLWQEYSQALSQAQAIVNGEHKTLPAFASACRDCHWNSACMEELTQADDLTLIPFLGRSKRDVMMESVAAVADLAQTDPSRFVRGKKTIFPGIGPPTLAKFCERAQLLTAAPPARPYLTQPLQLPEAPVELFFDLEVDPMRDHCYLHGFLERRNRDRATEKFVYFLADEVSAEAEKEAFAKAWAYLQASQPCAVYFYGAYEKSMYRKLRDKYPDVCSEEELTRLFAAAETVDLYNQVIRKSTEWPTHSYSLKTLAQHLGFEWRDSDPSGAASIEWFHRWTETGNEEIRQRILEYNEDDCRATRVLRDALEGMGVAPPSSLA